jgi:hypothetical protein
VRGSAERHALREKMWGIVLAPRTYLGEAEASRGAETAGTAGTVGEGAKVRLAAQRVTFGPPP